MFDDTERSQYGQRQIWDLPVCDSPEIDTRQVGGADFAYLSEGAVRFNELQRKMPKMTHATLSVQLKQLEADGLVIRTEYPQIPPKVEYSLSEIGEKFRCVLDSIEVWGQEYIEYMAK